MAQRINREIKKHLTTAVIARLKNCLVKLDFSKNGYYVQHLQCVKETTIETLRDVKRRLLNSVPVREISVPKVILILCVADCRR